MYRKIGRGLQYTVYDMDNDRVVKKTTTRLEKLLVLCSWGLVNPFTMFRTITEAERMNDSSVRALNAVPNVDGSLIGNPQFIDGYNYEQDKVIPLETYFTSHTLEENKVAIDAWIENTKALWRYGLADTVFNFSFNHGVANDGKVILMDLGELTNDQAQAERHIEQKKWLLQRSFLSLEDRELKTFIEKKTAEAFTQKEFIECWNIELRNTFDKF